MALRPEAVRRRSRRRARPVRRAAGAGDLDRLLAVATVDTLLSEVVLPYLRELGRRWLSGDASVAQEHFASSVVRGRLLGLARGWGLGPGRRRCSRACQGSRRPRPDRVRAGAALAGLARRLSRHRFADRDGRGGRAPARSSLVVLTAVSSERVLPVLPQLQALSGRHRLALGGAAAAERRAGGQRRPRPVRGRSPRRRGSRRSFRAASSRRENRRPGSHRVRRPRAGSGARAAERGRRGPRRATAPGFPASAASPPTSPTANRRVGRSTASTSPITSSTRSAPQLLRARSADSRKRRGRGRASGRRPDRLSRRARR